MSTASFDGSGKFRIGRVFGDTFSVLGRNLPLCFGLAVIFSGIPAFLFQLLLQNQVQSAVGAVPEFDWRFVVGFIGGLLISIVLGSMLQAGLVRATIEDLNGQRPSFADSFNRALAVLLPVIGLSLLFGLGVTIGLMLLVVPGIMLALRWAVAVPVLVQERLGVTASMSRSAGLTKGNRWRLLGFFVILILAIILLQLVLQLATPVLVSLLGTAIGIAWMALVQAASTVVTSIALAVIYVELRYVKEGADVKELAEIFA